MMRKIAAAGLATLMTLTAFATPASAATVRLTANEKAQLQYLVQEEKLARDVYTYLGGIVGTRKFSNIAQAEQTHMNYVASLLRTYGVANPTIGAAPGEFKDQRLADLYRSLTTSGSASYVAALQAGIDIETMDIADLRVDIASTTRPDILTMLNALLRGSQNHLAAFTR